MKITRVVEVIFWIAIVACITWVLYPKKEASPWFCTGPVDEMLSPCIKPSMLFH